MVRSLLNPTLVLNDITLFAVALFEFTQNTYIGSEGVSSPPDIPFAIRLAAGSAVLSQPVTVTVTSGAGSATGTTI